jgi:hypothetical protein
MTVYRVVVANTNDPEKDFADVEVVMVIPDGAAETVGAAAEIAADQAYDDWADEEVDDWPLTFYVADEDGNVASVEVDADFSPLFEAVSVEEKIAKLPSTRQN